MNSIIITFKFNYKREGNVFRQYIFSSSIKYLSNFLVNINEQSFILEMTHSLILLMATKQPNNF